MKISTRLSASFSLIASSIYVIFGIAIYLFSSNHRKEEFQERLKERLDITEKIFLEKESFSPAEFEKIRNQFLNMLPEETEEVVEMNGLTTPNFKHPYPEEVKKELLKNENYFFEIFQTQGISKVFTIKGKKYVVIVTALDSVGLQNLSYLKYRIIFLILIGLPIILIASYFITKKALFPLSEKIKRANAIGASNLDQRLEVFNPEDEIGELAIAFNKLLDRLEASFDAQKDFISNASHEIRNPLTAIMGEAEIAVSKSRSEEEYVESLNAILSESELLSATVNNLLQLSKEMSSEESIRFEKIAIQTFVLETKQAFMFVNPENKITIQKAEMLDKTYVKGNRNLLKAGLFNLFDNACKFSNNQAVEIELVVEDSTIEIVISDSGIGISEEEIVKILAPFYRGGNTFSIQGSGIGLSLVDKIATLHGGKLLISSKLDTGTVVRLNLPVVAS